MADSLHCIKTVCVIISNEGQILNIDPLKFYNTLYAIIPSLPFQENSSNFLMLNKIRLFFVLNYLIHWLLKKLL